MYEKFLGFLREKPGSYAPSTSPFWDDEYISRMMLKAHLDPALDAASRNHAFIRASARWIAGLCAPKKGGKLIDFGCGPGLYAERFTEEGFSVTGVDFSRRSIAYAKQSAAEKNLPIRYLYGNYLDVETERDFDVATIIYCDYGALPPDDRHLLLKKAFCALKPGGLLVLDALTEKHLSSFREGVTTEHFRGGFWSEEEYVCVQTNAYYPETRNTLEQYVVVTADDCRCYNIWNQLYDKTSLASELREAGFDGVRFFGDVGGGAFSDASDTLCAVASRA